VLSKFTIPKSLLSFASSPGVKRLAETVASLPEQSERPSLIKPHPALKTNELLSEHKAVSEEQLQLMRAEILAMRSSTSRASLRANLANIIAIIAIAIAAKDQIIELVISWLQ
jgi:hypothetical protein